MRSSPVPFLALAIIPIVASAHVGSTTNLAPGLLDPFAASKRDVQNVGVDRWFPGDDPALRVWFAWDPRNRPPFFQDPREAPERWEPFPDLDRRVRVGLIRGKLRWEHRRDWAKLLDERTIPGAISVVPQPPDAHPYIGGLSVILQQPEALEPDTYELVVFVTDPALTAAVGGEPDLPSVGGATLDIGPPRTLRERLFMHYRRAIIAGNERRYPEMLAEVDTLLALEPKTSEGLWVRAQALVGLGRMAEATAALQAAVNLRASGADSYYAVWREVFVESDRDSAASLVEWGQREHGLHVTLPPPPPAPAPAPSPPAPPAAPPAGAPPPGGG